MGDTKRIPMERAVRIAIKFRRHELGMSQGDVAERMPVSRPTVSQLESGSHQITIQRLVNFAEALDLSVDDLLERATVFRDEVERLVSEMLEDS